MNIRILLALLLVGVSAVSACRKTKKVPSTTTYSTVIIIDGDETRETRESGVLPVEIAWDLEDDEDINGK